MIRKNLKSSLIEDLFSLKICVETVRNSETDQNCETTNKQKSLNRRQDQQEKCQPQQNVNKRRLLPVIKQYLENQTTFTKVISGPASYSDTVKSIKKVAV